MTNSYIVITADMVDSRSVAVVLRNTLSDKLKRFDNVMDTCLPSSIYAGDEIQILLKNHKDNHPWLIFFQLLKILQPLKFRFGIGIGEIELPIVTNLAQNNGSAFLMAREALIKASDKKSIFCIDSNGIYSDKEFNVIGIFLSFITKKWNEKHWRRFFLYEEKRNIHKVAEREKISPEAINKFINNAGIRDIIASLDTFNMNKSTILGDK